jgi:membrane associated rhomboid family serine protease
MLGMVITRILRLKKQGIEAINFGKLDKPDFLIPPFALFCFYIVFAATFNFSILSTQNFSHNEVIAWAGAFFGLVGLSLLFWSLVSFGQISRVGIDTKHPGKSYLPLHGLS